MTEGQGLITIQSYKSCYKLLVSGLIDWFNYINYLLTIIVAASNESSKGFDNLNDN